MPFDSAGNFTRVHNWEDDRLNGIEIVSEHHDEEDDNIANALSETFLRDARVPMEGTLNMGGFKIQSCAEGVEAGDVVTKKQLDAISSNYVPITGDCEIYDIKAFLTSPTVPDLSIYDESNMAVNSKFVHAVCQNKIDGEIENIVSTTFSDFQEIQTLNSGQTAPANGLVIFDLPPRMEGFVQVGNYSRAMSYSYNNTQPSIATFPVKKGTTIKFSGCTCKFTSI